MKQRQSTTNAAGRAALLRALEASAKEFSDAEARLKATTERISTCSVKVASCLDRLRREYIYG